MPDSETQQAPAKVAKQSTPKKSAALPQECPERGTLTTAFGVQMYIK